MSTVGLELSNFINPNLTWKTVSKGRSTLRRSRRPMLKDSKMGHEQNKSPNQVESQRSESGKMTGVARRFSDGLEHIPIKKRRFLFRSPSPPPQSPDDQSSKPENSSCVSRQPTIGVPQKLEIDSSNLETSVGDMSHSGMDGKILKATDDMSGCGDDFSGIAILAAAACIDMLDKPSASTTNEIDETVMKEEHNKPLKAHITVEDSLPASSGVNLEGTKTSSASRDDRLHWDLNTPMDEWDHPLDDTIVDSAMKMESTTVDSLVNQEHSIMCSVRESTPQPSTGGVNTSEALFDVTHKAGTELSQMWDCHNDKLGVITGEKLSELTQNASDISLHGVDRVETIQEHGAGLSFCMKDDIKDNIFPSDISNFEVVDRVETTVQSLQLGSNDTKTLLSKGKSMGALSSHQHVVKGHAESAVEVGNNEKSEINLLLRRIPVEAKCDTDDASCIVMKNMTKIMESDERRKEINEHPFRPFQHDLIPSEKQELASSDMGASVGAGTDERFNNIPHANVIKDLEEMPKGNEVETKVNNARHQPHSLDAKKCEVEPMRVSVVEEQTRKIDSNREDVLEPENKNDFGCTSCNLGDVSQPVEPYEVGSENASFELEVAGISDSSKLEDMVGFTFGCDGKSTESAHDVETKEESIIAIGYEAHKRMESTPVKVDENQVAAPLNQSVPCEDSSDHALKTVPSSQVVTSGLDGGYDSYLEDGEFRESVEHNDGENRETEQVDYDSDNRDGYEFADAANGPIAEKVVAEVLCEKQINQSHEHLQCEDGLLPIEKKIEEDKSRPQQDSFLADGDPGVECQKENASCSKSIAMAQLNAMDNPEVVDMDLDDGRKSSIVSDDHKEDENDCFDDFRDLYMKGTGLKDSRKELHSQIEGPLSSDRRGTHAAPAISCRYGVFNHSYYRDERQFGVDESLGRGRSLRIDRGGRIGGRYWNYGLRSVVANPATEDDEEKFYGSSDDTSIGVHRQGMFAASRGGYTHFGQKGSPAGRSEEYGMGIVKVRDATSEVGQRNRYDKHLSGMSRGLREGYRRPIYETPNSSSSLPNQFIRRERSFSPGGSRMDPHPPRSRRRARSRSRSQSPDLRPDGRMGRMRLQYQNTDYFRERRSPLKTFGRGQRFETSSGRLRSENCLRPAARSVRHLDLPPPGRAPEYEDDDDYKRKTYLPRSHRRSRSRSRSCSPEFRSEARMGTMRLPYPPTSRIGDQITERRSPPRMFRPVKRFDAVGSPNRLRSDDYLRPIARPVRFQDAGQPSRGNEYEGDDYRRKSRTIFDRIRPTRNYDMEGDSRRFDYDAEEGIATQSFRREDFYARGDDRRAVDLVRGAREERSNLRFNSERVYSTALKPFGIREYNDDTLPRRLRPE